MWSRTFPSRYCALPATYLSFLDGLCNIRQNRESAKCDRPDFVILGFYLRITDQVRLRTWEVRGVIRNEANLGDVLFGRTAHGYASTTSLLEDCRRVIVQDTEL